MNFTCTDVTPYTDPARYILAEYFSVPLHVARRKLSGMRDSLVASSVWRPRFKKPLETFPNFEITELDFTEYGCDACNLGGRLSTREGRVSGAPYDKLSFEVSDAWYCRNHTYLYEIYAPTVY